MMVPPSLWLGVLYLVMQGGGVVAEWARHGGLSNALRRRRQRPRGALTRLRGVVEPLATMRSPMRGHLCVGARVELLIGGPPARRVSSSTVADFVLRTAQGPVVVRGEGAVIDQYAPPASALEAPLPAALSDALGPVDGDVSFSELALFPGDEVEVVGRLTLEPAPAALPSAYRGATGVPTLVPAGPSLFIRPSR